MKKFKAHKHYWWGENHQHHEGQETIIKMSFPRVFIRYEVGDAYFATYEEFYNSIAEVQWFDGDELSDKKKEEILIEAWNFLAIEERLLEEDLEDIDDDDLY
jgi:hypothetical protein